jgi:hypothetical protein
LNWSSMLNSRDRTWLQPDARLAPSVSFAYYPDRKLTDYGLYGLSIINCTFATSDGGCKAWGRT